MTNEIPEAAILSRAPFCIPEGLPLQQLTDEMTECFRYIGSRPGRTAWCFDAAWRSIGLEPQDPLVSAGKLIAADMDGGIGDGHGNAYHNRQHFCEVVLSSLCLSKLAGLSVRRRAEVVFAALIHDFHHDGKPNGEQIFRLEQIAVSAAEPYIRETGVPTDEMERIASLVLATEVSIGVPYAIRCYTHYWCDGEGTSIPVGPPLLHSLSQDADLALQAVLLAEADLMPSVGLTIAHSMLCQSNLEKEWGVPPLGHADKLAFLDGQFQGFRVGKLFVANIQRLRQYLMAKLAATGQ